MKYASRYGSVVIAVSGYALGTFFSFKKGYPQEEHINCIRKQYILNERNISIRQVDVFEFYARYTQHCSCNYMLKCRSIKTHFAPFYS